MIYKFLKDFSNKACFDTFEAFFGKGQMLEYYLKSQKLTTQVLIEAINAQNFEFVNLMLLGLVTDGPGDNADGKNLQIEDLFERIGSVPSKPVVESDADGGDDSEGPQSEVARP